jgi:hypothetical protein
MMEEIYSSCQKTIIWLGEDPNPSSPLAPATCWKCLGLAEIWTVHFKAFRKFVSVPWWKRIWVIQEMVLLKSLKFLYSSEEFPYETLKSVVQGL